MSCPFVSDVASLVVVILQHEDVGGGNPFKDEFIKPSDDLPDNLFDNSSDDGCNDDGVSQTSAPK